MLKKYFCSVAKEEITSTLNESLNEDESMISKISKMTTELTHYQLVRLKKEEMI
jgi:hypothetical protein